MSRNSISGLTAIFIFIVVALLVAGPTAYGLYLAFKASIILGIAAMIFEPAPAVLGWLAIFGRSDLCEKLAHWLNLPF